MKKAVVLMGILITVQAHADVFLFKEVGKIKDYVSQVPFKVKRDGKFYYYGPFDKNTALNFRDEFKVRYGIPLNTAEFYDQKDFINYLRTKESKDMINLLQELERLKQMVKNYHSIKFNSCLFIKEIDSLEEYIIGKYNLKTNFPQMVEKIYLNKITCGKKDGLAEEVAREKIVQYINYLVDKYKYYPDIRKCLENLASQLV